MRRTPVIIRLDGKAFHTFTKGFVKPFDECMSKAMQETMKYLCENIQGCVLGYTQSDEITLVLIDYQKLTTDAWFDYNVQKICSVAASMATLIFNRRFQEQIVELSYNGKLDDDELTSSYNPKNRIPTPYLDKEGKVERRRKRRAYGSQGWKGWGGEIYFKKYGEIMMDVVDKKKARREAKKHIENELQDQL